MELKRFEELALAYGAARRRWPEHERALFDAFADSPAGRSILADAERLDGALDGWLTATDDEARVARVVAAATFRPVRPALVAWLSTGFAVCALGGFLLGFSLDPDVGVDGSVYELLLGSTVIEELL